MNEKKYEFHTDTYQTGRTQPPRHYGGLVAFLIVLVILLSGISTALSIMNMRLYFQLNPKKETTSLAFSRSEDAPTVTETVHGEVLELQESLGISATLIPEVYQRYYKLPFGIYVTRIDSGSEAQEKGMLVGDIITAINGVQVQALLLTDQLAAYQADEPVELTVYRSGTEMTVTLYWTPTD